MTVPKAQKMWGGRFERAPDASSTNSSVPGTSTAVFCRRSWRSIAPGRAPLPPREFSRTKKARRSVAALDEIESRAQSDAAWLDDSKAEDVHHFAETALIEKLGPLGAKLHTGRSRNEMVATEFRMYVRSRGARNAAALALLPARDCRAGQTAISAFPCPGPRTCSTRSRCLLSHWLLAHGEAFQRDAERSRACRGSADSCPLGSGALAGCAFPLDRKALARDLGFSRITANSLDAVSDRDFALESLFALSTLAMHLSRLSEDMILFASPEFGFVELPDEYSTGSSLMPQKKNPDAWELIRGKTGRIYGRSSLFSPPARACHRVISATCRRTKNRSSRRTIKCSRMVRIAAAALAATRFREARLREAAQDPGARRHRSGGLSGRSGDSLSRSARNRRESAACGGEGRESRFAKCRSTRLKEFSPAFGSESEHGADARIGAGAARASRAGPLPERFAPRSKISTRGSRSSRKILRVRVT